MKIAITGASGLIGTALARSLTDDGHEVLRLVRRPTSSPLEATWDPMLGTVDLARLEGSDAVVHLAGAGVGDRRWTESYKREIRDSRMLGTATIANAAAALDPHPRALVSASAIGYYGDTGDRVVTEDDPPGEGFLADVVRAWETAARPAVESGIRVTHPRSGLVVAGKGGAWGRLWPLFKLGVGGKMGSGHQWWSWISLRDEVRALRRLIDDDSMSGAYNLTAPNPATNAEITTAMGEVLHRPTALSVPSFALRLALGEMSQEVLGSARVQPARLLAAGFTFDDATIDEALASALSSV
ncbi:MAG: TIGR01777 family oxidoreductase [Actinomycetes bacterium]